jgi:hypothetical protein
MDAEQHIWQVWAHSLHRWGVNEVAAAFLEAGGPLNLVLAQGIYLVQPLFSSFASKNHLETLARVLEEPEETQSFVNYLREGSVT